MTCAWLEAHLADPALRIYDCPTNGPRMPLGEATVCGYDNGQVLLFTGEQSTAAFDRVLTNFGQEDLPRTGQRARRRRHRDIQRS